MAKQQPQGFLALPSSGKGPGVLVLHAWWGLNETIKTVCAHLADSGYVAFAPDLYHGRVVDTIAEAKALSSELFQHLDSVSLEVKEAAKFLHMRVDPSDHGLAVIGFSLGAFFALDVSISYTEQIRTVVSFYGTRPGDYSHSKAAYQGHFAEKDEFEPQSEVDNLEESLRRANRPVTFFQYEGTGHWFFEPDRAQVFDPVAADLAWERTLAFLKKIMP